MRFGTTLENVRQLTLRRDFCNRQQPLVHRKSRECFQQLFFGNKDIDLFRSGLQERFKFAEPFFRQQNRNHLEMALEQSAHDFLAFGYENSLLAMLRLVAHRAVGLQLRKIERCYVADCEHSEEKSNTTRANRPARSAAFWKG